LLSRRGGGAPNRRQLLAPEMLLLTSAAVGGLRRGSREGLRGSKRQSLAGRSATRARAAVAPSPCCCPPPLDVAMPGLSHTVPLREASQVYGRLLSEAERADQADGDVLSALREIQRGGGAELTQGVFALGHAGGHNAYLLRLSGFGNILVDCPEYSDALADAIGGMGGVAMLFCTQGGPEPVDRSAHSHAKWMERFPGLQRVTHAREGAAENAAEHNAAEHDAAEHDAAEHDAAENSVAESPGPAEVVLTGHGPFRNLGCGGVEALHVPGHTSGACVLHLEGIAAFTGDHLALEFDDRDKSLRLDSIMALAEDWKEARKSMAALAVPDVKFLWILPAHGEPFRFRDQEERMRMLNEVVYDMGLCANAIPWASLHDDECVGECEVDDSSA